MLVGLEEVETQKVSAAVMQDAQPLVATASVSILCDDKLLHGGSL